MGKCQGCNAQHGDYRRHFCVMSRKLVKIVHPKSSHHKEAKFFFSVSLLCFPFLLNPQGMLGANWTDCGDHSTPMELHPALYLKLLHRCMCADRVSTKLGREKTASEMGLVC